MLILAFDTATDVATSALVWDGEVLGEQASRAVTLLEDVDALLRRGGVRDTQLEGMAAGLPGSLPVVDGKRKEVFALVGGRPAVLRPEQLAIPPGTTCVGDGAVRYRELLERAGADVPPDTSDLHVPRARFHAQLARDFGPADAVEPLYLRAPDAVVAVDVRRGALEAVLHLPRRLRRRRRRRARGLRDRLALCRRVARDEHRRRSVVAAARDRGRAPRPALRRDGERLPPRLHARGARLERGRDHPLRAHGLPPARDPPGLLHGQPRGRVDHVARPGRPRSREGLTRPPGTSRGLCPPRTCPGLTRPGSDPGHGPGGPLSVAFGRVSVSETKPCPGRTRGSTLQRVPELMLGIETSCDETAAAVVTDDGRILANVVASQAELHARFGGVVPEVASRPHLELALPVVREALGRAGATLADLGRIAVTTGPGLIGALLVGLSAAKALAWARRLPLVGVDHLHGHVASLFLDPDAVEPPFLCLLASGGHTLLLDVPDRSTYRVLGTTIDDAAGEAFDKGARLLGLGYPGGAAVDRLARDGDPTAHQFPVARVPGLDFSFSGLKTALLYAVRDLDPEELERRRADLAASYQHAIVRALVGRTRQAAEETGAGRIAVVGGVAANSELRAALPDAALAPLPLCTDNAAMIASAGRYAEPVPYPDYLSLDANV